LTDEIVAPETKKFIDDLQEELKNKVDARDKFDRGIAAYNAIPGASQLRDALNLNDDFRFAAYVRRNPNAFNEALRGITKAAEDVDRSPDKLSAAEMRGLVAQSVVLERAEETDVKNLNTRQLSRARRLSGRPGRLRRKLARQTRREDDKTAQMVAQLGLANVPDIVEEASQPSSTARTAQPAPQPPPQPQPQSDATQDASAQTEDAAAAQRAAEEDRRTVEVISGEERARQRAESQANNELKEQILDILRDAGALDQVDQFMSVAELQKKYNLQIGGGPAVVTPDPVDQYLTAEEQAAKASGAAVGNRLGETPVDPVIPNVDQVSPSGTSPTSQVPATPSGSEQVVDQFGVKKTTGDEVEQTDPTPGDTPAGSPPPSGGLGGEEAKLKKKKKKEERNVMLAGLFGPDSTTYG
jgi:hypothetical protein